MLTSPRPATLLTGSSLVADMRAEVALLDSNVRVLPSDGNAQYRPGGDKYGPRIVAAGNSTARLSHLLMQWCGQAGLSRACVQFEDMAAPANMSSNPSCLNSSAVLFGMDSALTVRGRSSIGVVAAGG